MHKVTQQEIDEVCEAVGTSNWGDAYKEGLVRASRMPLIWEIAGIVNQLESVLCMANLRDAHRKKLDRCSERLRELVEGCPQEEFLT